MTTAQSHPRRARHTLPALLIAICLAMASIGSAATAQSPAPQSSLTNPQVLRAAAAVRAADRTLVSRAKSLTACRIKHRPHCIAERRAVQRTGSRLAARERRLATLAHKSHLQATIASAATRPPHLTVSGETLHWTRPGNVRQFVLVSMVPGQEPKYSVLDGTAITPPPVPGYTVHYNIRTNVNGSRWASEQSIAYPAAKSSAPPTRAPTSSTPTTRTTTPTAPTPSIPPSSSTPPTAAPANPQTAPIISVSGQTVTWTQIGGVSTYVFVSMVPGQEPRYTVVNGTSITPATVPGATVRYSVRTNVAESAWAPEVSIAYPASSAPVSEAPAEPPSLPVTGKIIGTNDGAGWGPAAAQTILGGHVTWNRVEIGMESNTPAASLADGFHNLAIVGNIEDGTPLSQFSPSGWASTVVSQLQSNPGISIAEAGNEMYLKGNVANPTRYGQMYLDAVNAMQAAGIDTPLLFNMVGDYPTTGTWSSSTGYSRDSQGGGWLHDAVASVPGLGAAILANGLSTHPYGALGENSDDTNGVNAVAAQEAVAQRVLGAVPPFYITEFGYSLSNCGESDGACSEPEQATKMRAAYRVLLADPHVEGIWWYQSHDDSSGRFGYMNSDNTTRPSFETLSSIAVEQGQ
jgi:hypothetical protein